VNAAQAYVQEKIDMPINKIKVNMTICQDCRHLKGTCKKGILPKVSYHGKPYCKRHRSK